MWITIRTASGDRLLSANPADVLSTVPLANARGRENFLVHLTCPKWPRVAILHQGTPGVHSLASKERNAGKHQDGQQLVGIGEAISALQKAPGGGKGKIEKIKVRADMWVL
jgi:hypothetical protein